MFCAKGNKYETVDPRIPKLKPYKAYAPNEHANNRMLPFVSTTYIYYAIE